MLDYMQIVRSESARFYDLVAATDSSLAVPTCPGWSVADLTWHLAEVQYFWAAIVGRLLLEPGSIPDLERPRDEALPDLFREQSQRVVEALQRRNPADECWSWHKSGDTVGWVRRRQAHEALIHRVDAELAAGNVPAIGENIAADGVEEVLSVYLDAGDLPEWATFHGDGSSARLRLDDGASWTMLLGRFTGTSPQSGTTYDEPAMCLSDLDATPDVELNGSASSLDLWLWGRGPVDDIEVVGKAEMVPLIREMARAGTQ